MYCIAWIIAFVRCVSVTNSFSYYSNSCGSPTTRGPNALSSFGYQRARLKLGVVPPHINLLSGMLSGAIGVGVAYPIDTLKVKTQTFLDTAEPGDKAPSAWALAALVAEEEGVGAFYSGVSLTMFGQALIKGAVFFTYEAAQRVLEQNLGVSELHGWWIFLAACASGAVGSFLVTPVERIKCVMQAAKADDFSNPLECIRRVVDSDGLGGLLFRGIGVTLLREVPSYGLYFLAYEFTKSALLGLLVAVPGSLPHSTLALLEQCVPLVGGAAAGVASWVPVYPIDVVKTNVQVAVDGGRRESALQVSKRIYGTGGAWAFWDGIGPKVLRAVVNHAVTFFCFEQAISFYSQISPATAVII